jgi:predicted Zn-dependent protease
MYDLYVFVSIKYGVICRRRLNNLPIRPSVDTFLQYAFRVQGAAGSQIAWIHRRLHYQSSNLTVTKRNYKNAALKVTKHAMGHLLGLPTELAFHRLWIQT